MITLDDSHDESRAKMPCGHVISKQSMTTWLRDRIKARKYQIYCPGRDRQNKMCPTVWDWSLCRKVGVLTQQEIEEFETALDHNYTKEFLGGQDCPHCKALIIKPESLGNRVKCSFCKKADFCWKCLCPWRGSGSVCGNEVCAGKKDSNYLLKTCPTKTIDHIEGVPIYRACPKCESLISHKEACRHMTC